MRVPTRRSEKDALQKIDPHITEEKFTALQSELDRLKKVSRFKLMKEVATLAEMGDLSENAAYQIAKGKLRGINQRILDLEAQLKRAIIIKANLQTNVVQLGSKVTVEIDGMIKAYLILGSTEVDPFKNIISHNSPLGAVLLGASKNQIISREVNNKKVSIKILEIS